MFIILASYESHAIKYKIIIIKLICKSSMTMLGFKGIKNCGILKKRTHIINTSWQIKKVLSSGTSETCDCVLSSKNMSVLGWRKKKQGGNERHFSSHKMKSYICVQSTI